MDLLLVLRREHFRTFASVHDVFLEGFSILIFSITGLDCTGIPHGFLRLDGRQILKLIFDLFVVQIVLHVPQLLLLEIIFLIMLQTLPLVLRSKIRVLYHFLDIRYFIILVHDQVLQLLNQLLLAEVFFLELLQQIIMINRTFMFTSDRMIDVGALRFQLHGGSRTLVFIKLFNMVVKQNGIVRVLF